MIAWNEEETIAFSIKHYQKFCSKIFVYDNFSDDRTREIAEELGCTVSLFGTAGVLDDLAYKNLKNSCWKGSDADFVIIVDKDEILYDENIILTLRTAKMKGQTIIKTQGYAMHSDKLPKEDWLEIKMGHKDNNYSKLVCFNPAAVDIGYEYGCHTHMKDYPKGIVNYADEKLSLLHYNFVGGVDRIIKRWKEYEPRRQKSVMNMRWNLGHRYSKTEAEIKKEWAESGARSKELSEVIIG